MNKLRIAILSDSPFLTTGYANQAVTIANILSERGHDVTYFGQAYVGQNIKPGVKFEDDQTLNFKIVGGGREPYFKDLLPRYVKEMKIDVLMILLDTFMLYPWLMTLDLSPAKTIFYYPSDGGGALPAGCEQILKFVDQPIAMAKYGQTQLKNIHNVDSIYIPHATHMSNFYRLSDTEIGNMKQSWNLQDKFVIGVVARNQGRKMLDRTIKIMAEYAKINSDAILLMHCDPDDAAQVFPLAHLIQRYNLQNRVMFTGTKYYRGFSYKDMNQVYNLMDVFLLSTSGEGFGIPIIEAMACGIPVLATDYTTTQELILDHNAGLGIDLVGTSVEENPRIHGSEIIDGTITGSWTVERGICSIKDGVKKLDTLYKDKELRKKMGENGIAAVKKYYNWDVTRDQWTEIFEKLGGQW